MQRGSIVKRHGAWHLRYRLNGKEVSVKLADYSDEYRTKSSVGLLARKILAPLNDNRPSGTLSVQEFAETVYFPSAKTKLKPSTYRGYFNLYQKHLRSRVGGFKLATFTTADGQRLLYKISEQEKLSHQSFLNINSLLSAIFTHARRIGTLSGSNPMDGVEIPEGERTKKTYKYSLDEVQKITAAVQGIARTIVVVAAWTGLSLAELRGLQWLDIDFEREQLEVKRTVWHREIVSTKTAHRAAVVHLLPNVIQELQEHRKRCFGTTWVFEGPHVFPYDLANIGSTQIKPALKGTGVEWHGIHAFRRGLGTRLFNNGVPTKVIAQILRHGSGSEVTEQNYIDVDPDTAREALKNLPR